MMFQWMQANPAEQRLAESVHFGAVAIERCHPFAGFVILDQFYGAKQPDRADITNVRVESRQPQRQGAHILLINAPRSTGPPFFITPITAAAAAVPSG